MKWLLPATLACAASAIGTQAEAQSRYDICAAYARDAMTGFYASSAVPVTMAARAWEADRGATAMTGKRRAASQTIGSVQTYFEQCMTR